MPYCLPKHYAAKGNFSAFVAQTKTRIKGTSLYYFPEIQKIIMFP